MNREDIVSLAYDKYDGTDEMMPHLSPVVFIHGVLDTKANWSDIANTVADRSVRMVYTIDLPNHGDNAKIPGITSAIFLRKIEEFILKIGEPVIMIGHSLGSVAAIHIALTKPHLTKMLVLIDFAPIWYPSDTGLQIVSTLNTMKDALKIVPSGLNFSEAKARVDNYLKSTTMVNAVRNMILPTLIQEDDGLKWKTKLTAAEILNVNSAFRHLFPFVGTYNGDTVIIKAEHSKYIRKEDYAEIKKIFPNVKFQSIKDCRHWIHMEKKQELIEAILMFLSRR